MTSANPYGVVKKLVLISPFLFVAPLATAGSRSQEPISKATQAFECMSEFKDNLYKDLGPPPVFKNSSQAVKWIRKRLPKNFNDMFKNSAQELLYIAGPRRISGLAKSGKLFYRVLSIVTFHNLTMQPDHRNSVCSSGNVYFLFAATLSDYLAANHETAVIRKIRHLTGDDPMMESRLFVLLFTLDATGKPWKLGWLSDAEAAQNELERYLSNQRRNP